MQRSERGGREWPRKLKTSNSVALLENELHAADAELSDSTEMLSALRARFIRAFIESRDAARETADRLSTGPDELNLRLEALCRPKKFFPKIEAAPGHLQRHG